MQTLDVLNACIATTGEHPLNAINDPHPLRFAALSLLNNESRLRQTVGRWYNMEDATLDVSPADSKIYLPGDTIGFRAPTRDVVVRGRNLYDVRHGTNIFVKPVSGTLIRLIPFESLPESAAQYIAAEVVLKFQMSYDGDSNKTGMLKVFRDDAKVLENIEHIRDRKSNFIDNNSNLQRLKAVTRRARRFIQAQ